MFRELLTYTIDSLQSRFEARPLDVPERYARREGTMRGKPLVMTNVAFETEHLRKVRLTYMDGGDAAQILTTMVFPRPYTDLPIFAADVLGFRGQPHLIVIDHQPLFKDDADYEERYITPMADVYHRYVHLPTKERHLPAWTEAFFSKYTHYSRPQLEDLPEVLNAYRAYWDLYLDQAETLHMTPQEEPRIHARQAEYCADHIANEQAEGMLQNLFGEAWCEAFIHDFLFDVRPQ